MIHIFVELSAYRQIMKLRPASIDSIIQNLKGLVEYSGGHCEFCENGSLLFSIDPLESGQEGSVELIHHIYAVLLEKRRELQGFVVVADQHSNSLAGTTFPVLGQLRRSAMFVDRSDSLWLGHKLWDFIGEGFVGEEQGTLVQVVERTLDGPDSISDSSRFFVRPELSEQIRRSIEARQRGQGTTGWIQLCAPPISGVAANIERALSSFVRDKQFRDWCFLGSGRDSLTLLEPFLEGINRDFLGSVPEFLSKSDRMLWEQRVGILQFACPDYATEDFFSIFSLYLLAYSRFMKRHHLPPVLVCPQADRYPPATIRLLGRLLSRFGGIGQLIPVCITGEAEPLGELDSISHETIVGGELESGEVKERVEGFDNLLEADRERLAQVTEGQPLYLYHACLTGTIGKLKGVQITLELLRQRDIACRRILYATYLSDGLLGQVGIADLLGGLGLAEEVYKREYKNLVRLGLIDERSGRLTVNEIGHLLAPDLDADALQLHIAEYCYDLWYAGRLSVTAPQPSNPERIGVLFWFLSLNGRFDQALLVFLELMGRMFDQGRVEEALHYLEQENPFRMNLTAEETQRRDFFLELMALRASILLESKEQADLHLVRLREMQIGGEWEKGLLDLLSAQHHYAALESKLALDAAKRSLLSAQAIESGIQECRADIEIGLTMLAATKFEEAEEYFTLSRIAAPRESATFEHIRSLTFEAITLYLYGNVSKALRTAEEAGARAGVAGRREWQRLSLFLRGRCYFTLGLYEEALKVFQAGISFCRVYSNDEARKVFSAWAGRSIAYGEGGNPFKYFEGLRRDGEVLLYLSEYAAESGDLQAALELIEEALEGMSTAQEEYLPSETVPWASGYSAIEDRALKMSDGRGVLHFNSRALRAYLKGLSGEVDEAITEFTRLTREERLSESDPNNYHYYYLHSRIVPHGEGELLVDRLTVLSKALKHVQERATRIDDVKKRQAFLRRNRWNARLVEDAKSLKLM